MFEEHAELKARAGECLAQARREMDLAEKAADESRCTEHLKAALECLKLATEIRMLMRARDDASGAATPTIIPGPDPSPA